MPVNEDNQLKAKQKLNWLGLSSAAQSLSEIQEETNKLEEYYNTNNLDYIDFQNKISNLSGYSEFKTYLVDNVGFSSSEAAKFIEKIKQQFNSWSDFQDYVQFNTSNFSDIKLAFNSSNEFNSETTNENGQPAAGVRFHEEDGTTENNVSVPAGTTEIYGREVHFSQSNFTGDDSQEIDGEISYSNIRTDPSDGELNNNEIGQIKVDITNTQESQAVLATLTEDGNNIEQKEPYLNNGETITVTFDVIGENEYHEYQIQGQTNTVEMNWIPSDLATTS